MSLLTTIAAYKVKKRQEVAEVVRQRYDGQPVLWTTEKAKGFVWSVPAKIMNSVVRNRRTAVPACHGLGKALCLQTPIPTPNGWSNMKDLNIGDEVYDEQGNVTNIIGVSKIEERDVYRVMFSDGTYIDAADTHMWNVLDMNHRRRHVLDWRRWWSDTFIKTTKELFENQTTNSNQRRWSIPNTKPLTSNSGWIYRWAPYAFGCWIGDGTTTSWQLTCHKDDAQHFALYTDGEISKVNNRDNIRIIRLPGQATLDCPTRVYEVNKKFIPQEMLRESVEDRLELLRGIMDTDGYLTSHSTCVQVDLSDKELALQVAELIRTIGWIARINSRISQCTTTQKDGKISYRITFTPDENPFHLPRKAILWEAYRATQDTQFSRITKKTINNIEYIGKKLVKCIEVDSVNKLYLAGKGFVPTHNSWLSARLAAWWIASHPPGSAFVVTTAPSNKQVKAVLWKEIRRAWVAASLPGRLNQTEWWVNNELVAMGRKPSDYDPTAFQGIHAKFVLVILDEGCGIPEAIYIAANSLASNEFSRLLVIGNPDDPSSHFEKICKPGSGWNVIPVSAYDTPNFTGEYVPQDVKDVLVSPVFEQEMARDVGVDSPIYISKVLGRFPENAIDGVVPLSFIRKCQDEDEYEKALGEETPSEILEQNEHLTYPREGGCDVGAGGDETSLRARYGKFVLEDIVEAKTPEPLDAYALVVPFIMKHNLTRIKIDTIGIGWGLIGMLEMCKARGLHTDETLGIDVDISRCEIVGVNVGVAATEPERFLRLRSQMWWEIARGLSADKGWNLTKLDETTVRQLIDPTYKSDSANRIVVESKQDTMKRTKRPSPNRADALLLAYCEPPTEEIEEVVTYYEPVQIGPEL